MNTQPTALRLADLIDWPSVNHGHEAAAELRRLHAENEALLEALKELSLYVAYNGDDWVQRKARAAIAAAEGEKT